MFQKSFWIVLMVGALVCGPARAQVFAQLPGPGGAPDNNGAVGNRGTQTMNPDISVILDAAAGWWQRQPLSLAGDDPDFGGDNATRGGGITLTEAELALSSNVDPYLRGDVYLTIPNSEKLEIEEAFMTTLDMPYDLQLKGGIFRSSISRQNAQHLHVQDFTRRPLINQTFLGVDGLRAPGVQMNWLVPLPFYSMLALEVMSVSSPDDVNAPLQTFGGGGKSDLTNVVSWRNFFPLGEEYSMYVGLDYGRGRSSSALDPAKGGYALGSNLATQLYGADLYIKYKPANYAQGFHSLTWQSEYFQRHFSGDDVVAAQNDGGFYSQIVYQFAQRWFWGVRYDYLGAPASQFVRPAQRYSTDITFNPTEFSRLRLYGENEVVATSDYPQLNPASSVAVMLQAEVSMGVHGAHAF